VIWDVPAMVIQVRRLFSSRYKLPPYSVPVLESAS